MLALNAKRETTRHRRIRQRILKELKLKNSVHAVERELFTKKQNNFVSKTLTGGIMSKKNKAKQSAPVAAVDANDTNVIPAAQTTTTTEKMVEVPAKEEKKKAVKQDKNDKKGKKKKEKKHVISKKTKETVSELKKVTWPKFPEVVKKTGVVLVVVIIFAVVLFGADTLFGFLTKLLTGK